MGGKSKREGRYIYPHVHMADTVVQQNLTHHCKATMKSESVGHSVVSDSATSWTIARQASLSMGFSRQEYWSGLSFPSPGDRPNPGIKPRSPALQADSLTSEPLEKPSEGKIQGHRANGRSLERCPRLLCMVHGFPNISQTLSSAYPGPLLICTTGTLKCVLLISFLL